MSDYHYGICSGYFNPLHDGHIIFLEEAEYDLHLKAPDNDHKFFFVIVNNDDQVKLKGSIPFLNQNIRKRILEGFSWITEVIIAKDKDKSVAETIEYIVKGYCVVSDDCVYFYNSGDRKKPNTKEDEICKKYGIEQVFLDLPKVNSSSEILDNVGREWICKNPVEAWEIVKGLF